MSLSFYSGTLSTSKIFTLITSRDSHLARVIILPFYLVIYYYNVPKQDVTLLHYIATVMRERERVEEETAGGNKHVMK